MSTSRPPNGPDQSSEERFDTFRAALRDAATPLAPTAPTQNYDSHPQHTLSTPEAVREARPAADAPAPVPAPPPPTYAASEDDRLRALTRQASNPLDGTPAFRDSLRRTDTAPPSLRHLQTTGPARQPGYASPLSTSGTSSPSEPNPAAPYALMSVPGNHSAAAEPSRNGEAAVPTTPTRTTSQERRAPSRR